MKKKLRAYAVADEAALVRFKPAVIRALEAIHLRSGGRYSAERVFEVLREQIRQPQVFALWLALDVDLLAQGPPVKAVVGLLTLCLVPDEVGMVVAYLSRAWIAPGYNGEPFDLAMPLVKRWAAERGAVELIVTTERRTAAVSGQRSAASGGKAESRKLSAESLGLQGLVAYARWMERRGFEMGGTTFSMRLKP